RGQGKWILRQLLKRYVPTELVQKGKKGFSVPVGSWIRGPLREWAEELLDSHRLENEGYLRAEPIRRRWKEHLGGRSDWGLYLWDILMFQAWLERWK
ncbi:MAG: asparagine synthase-related protein, partial [Verrucomicrobiota bacterium]